MYTCSECGKVCPDNEKASWTYSYCGHTELICPDCQDNALGYDYETEID